MNTCKNSNIANFFKSLAQPRPIKRPFSSDGTEDENSARHSPAQKTNSLANSEKPPPQALAAGAVSTLQQDPLRIPTTSASVAEFRPTQSIQLSANTGSSPSASQGPMLTSSQRIVKNGETMITNSDDESDSDTSLTDLNVLLGTHLSKNETTAPAEPELPYLQSDKGKESQCGVSKRQNRGRPAKRPSEVESSLLAIPKYKFSIGVLAEQRKQYEESRDSVAKANSLLEARKHLQETENSQKLENTARLDADLIGKLMNDRADEDDSTRLKMAIERTEALQYEKSWSFFEGDSQDPSSERIQFPTVQDECLAALFRTTSSRQQAFLNGHIGVYVMRNSLPEELLMWITDVICLESRDDLRISYTTVLKNAARLLTPLLAPSRIDTLFRRLGASAVALNFERAVVPKAVISQSIEDSSCSRPNLLSLLQVLRDVACHLCPESRMHAIRISCRLVLDRNIVNSHNLIFLVEETLENLISSIPERDYEKELRNLSSNLEICVTNITLRLQLLQHIPTILPRLAILRRRLALAMFMEDNTYVRRPQNELLDLKAIAQHLQTPQFNITNNTDYAELAASIAMLGIGIDFGDPPSAPSKVQEHAFNSDIDILAAKIKAMYAQIIDTGASHMWRTEAKESLEGFHARLLYAVRTKPPPKTMIFGDATVDFARERNVMKEFLVGSQETEVLASTISL